MLEPEPGRRVTLGDKKSHYTALMVGFSIGALVSALIVVATAMAHNGG